MNLIVIAYVKRVATHAHTYIRRYSKTKDQNQIKSRKKTNKKKTKRGRGRKETRWGKRGGTKEKGKKEKQSWGEWVQVSRPAWVLRRVGPHTNNARST